MRVMDGVIKKGEKIILMDSKAQYEVNRIGVFAPEMVDRDELSAGEVGYLICGIKTLADAKVGDTITHKDKPAEEPLEGFSRS